MEGKKIAETLTKAKGYIEKYRTETAGLLMLLLLVLQRTIFGSKYFPVIDDWFLYYGRSMSEDVLSTLDLTMRPLAGLADAFMITPLAGHMIITELLLMVMLAASVYFLCRAFSMSRISSGAVLMTVAALSPIGFEGLYWIAASSRIISSLFFISLCVYSEARYVTGRKKRYLAVFIVSGLFSVGFYEMMVPIYFALTVIVMLKHRRSVWIMVFPVIFTAAAIIYYKLNMGDPALAERGEMIGKDLFSYHIWDMYDWYKKVFGSIQLRLLKESFIDGAKALAAHPVWAVLITAASAGFAAVMRGSRNEGRLWYDLLMGVGLIAAAISVMVILSYVRVPFRVAYPICIGVALVAEAVLCRILPGMVYRIAVFALVMFFSVCNIGELNLYRWNNERDEEYCAEVMEKADVFNPDMLVYIFNERDYWYNDRVQHYEYVKAVSENYACITGMIQYKAGVSDIHNVMTVNNGDVVKLYDLTGPDVETFYIDKAGIMQPCYAERVGDNYDILSDKDGYIGSLTRNGDTMRYDEYVGE